MVHSESQRLILSLADLVPHCSVCLSVCHRKVRFPCSPQHIHLVFIGWCIVQFCLPCYHAVFDQSLFVITAFAVLHLIYREFYSRGVPEKPKFGFHKLTQPDPLQKFSIHTVGVSVIKCAHSHRLQSCVYSP